MLRLFLSESILPITVIRNFLVNVLNLLLCPPTSLTLIRCQPSNPERTPTQDSSERIATYIQSPRSHENRGWGSSTTLPVTIPKSFTSSPKKSCPSSVLSKPFASSACHYHKPLPSPHAITLLLLSCFAEFFLHCNSLRFWPNNLSASSLSSINLRCRTCTCVHCMRRPPQIHLLQARIFTAILLFACVSWPVKHLSPFLYRVGMPKIGFFSFSLSFPELMLLFVSRTKKRAACTLI